jgi:alpha-beta hydrolase superfamily lysophospholipase
MPPLARCLISLVSLCLLAPCPLRAQERAAPSPVLWGDLTPGPFAIGYRGEWGRDLSRTWRVTRRAGRGFTPDSAGRPVRINIWYPATPHAKSSRMQFGDYTRVEAPAEFADFGRRLAARDSTAVASDVQPNEVTALLGLSVPAYREPMPASGRFPLVLIVAGLNDETTAQAVLAEFLASHGYVVAVVAWTGVNEDQFDAIRTQPGVEATVRDVEFAWSRLRTRSDVDLTRLAVMGHSLGGVIAVLTAMRNENVGAVVGLDATYGFAAAADVLTGDYGYAPRQMKAALLDVRRAAGVQSAELDLRAEHAFIYSDRTFVTLPTIRHSEFTTNALIASATHQPPIAPQYRTPGWTRETVSLRYRQTVGMVRDFLDAKLKGQSVGITRLAAQVAAIPGADMTNEAALPVPPLPPSPTELIAVAKARGFDAAVQLIDRHAREAPDDAPVDAPALNALGYSLMGQKQFTDAVTAFHLVLLAHPTSANAFDSYGDGLSAAGQTADACAAYARALALAPSDSTLGPADRGEIIRDETERMRSCPKAH